MKSKKLFAIAAIFAINSNAGLAIARRGAGDVTADGKPNVQSAASLVVNLSSGEVLFEKDADQIRPLASISKIVGALVIHEECVLKPDDLHEMSTANRDAAKGGDKTRLTTGWKFSHADLLHAALMRSDNRALPALGEACGMDVTKLAERMTDRVRRLGLKHTAFKEPNGLSAENVSTAREIMVFLKEALRVPAITEIMNKKDHTITAYKDTRRREIKIRNTDRLLGREVATILGGKTGYTDLAKYCLAIAARTDDNRELGMVFLGAEGKLTRYADFTRVVKWLARAESLLMPREVLPMPKEIGVVPVTEP